MSVALQAEQHGSIRANDEILRIDGVQTAGLSWEKMKVGAQPRRSVNRINNCSESESESVLFPCGR
jgi:hypothetical protein